jgi:hypothetical protein
LPFQQNITPKKYLEFQKMESTLLEGFKPVDGLEIDENFRRLNKKKGCELVLLELPKDVGN